MRWHTFQAMGTTVSVLAEHAAAAVAVERRFADLEARLSRFRPDSELCRINASAERVVTVSETMAAVLETAARLRSLTAGLVDPSMGRAIHGWGYDRTFPDVVDRADEPDTSELGPGPWGIEGRCLRRQPGVLLDLGGIAKGWSADVALAETGAWAINAGGDVASRHPDLAVTVVDPWDDEPVTVAVGAGALATSCTTRRAWRAGCTAAHHVLDPRTARPADGPVIQASAVAATAAEAEAAAKAMILEGSSSLAWAHAQPWVRAGLVVWRDGSIFGTLGLRIADHAGVAA